MINLNNILHRVSKPGRYTGGEWNSITKDWVQTPIRIALAYPEVYEVGMSNMALPILYEMFNREPDVLAERVYNPWVDMQAVMREQGIPLFSLESKHPLQEFDVVGFSLGYELTYTNVLSMLHLAGIPLACNDRDNSHPVIIAGGTCALNPEPMADFIDAFVIGDGEEVVPQLASCLRQNKGRPRWELLRRMATIPGVYVPAFYRVEYHADGTVKSITPTVPEASPCIKRQIISQLPPAVTRPVMSFIELIHDRGAVEISRGCSRGCRFCHASAVYRPVRERPQEEVVQAVDDIIANTGYDEVALVSLSTSDYSNMAGLVTNLAEHYRHRNIAISVPSLRIDALSVKLINALAMKRKSGLTFAPEAGSKRLQYVINKVTAEETLQETVMAAFDSGWLTLKLYFMLGLPTETIEDAVEIAEMANRVISWGSRGRGRHPQLRISLSTFVPKAHTPFQWTAQDTEPVLREKHEAVSSRLHRRGIKLSWHDPKVSLLEAVLSRGDRRLGKVIQRAWEMGSIFDAWSEHFNYQNWVKAFAETGLDPAFYAYRQRSLDEVLPWSHIDTGLSSDFLKREYQRSLEGKETRDCRFDGCHACGLQREQTICQERLKKAKAPE